MISSSFAIATFAARPNWAISWAMGDDYTVADGYLYVFCRWVKAAGLLDPERFPKLNAHIARMQARPAVQRALATEGIPAV